MKLESLDLNLLLVLEALASERSVTRAAAKIGLSQPALSNALSRLRTLFHDPLFERTGGQMQPTPRARQLLVPLSEAISKLREAFETQSPFRPEASEREFLIATNDYVDSLLLPRVVHRLLRHAPSAAIRAVRTDYLFLPPVERLQSGELDLALGFFGQTPQHNSGLLSKRLVAGRLVCILRAAHPRAARKLSLRTFVEIPHVRIMYPDTERQGSIDAILRSRGLARRIAVTVPHYLAIPAIVAESDLLGVVPEKLARRVAPRLRLKIFDPPVALPDISIVMAWHERLQFDRAHTWFREAIAATCAKLTSSPARHRPSPVGKDRKPSNPRRKA
ncbi:MAG TPA: LysR family transcriptional regulator [Chthoniobacterales bacterium]